MPRYYFDVLDDVAHTPDEEGMDLPDAQAAAAHARRTIAEVAADELVNGNNDIHLTVMINDGAGVRVHNMKAVFHLDESISPFSE